MQSLIISIGVLFCSIIIGYNFFKAQKQKYLGNIKEAKRYFRRTVILFILTAILWSVVISVIGVITKHKIEGEKNASFKKGIMYCSLPFYYSTLFSPGDIKSFSLIDSFKRNVNVQGVNYDVFEKKFMSKETADSIVVGIKNGDNKHLLNIKINQTEINFLTKKYNDIKFLGLNKSGHYIFYLTSIGDERVILSLMYISGKVEIIEYDTL